MLSNWRGRLLKTKKLFTNKEIINRKEKPTEWERIFTSYIAYRLLVSIIYKELKNRVKKWTHSKKWVWSLNSKFWKKEIKMVKKYHKMFIVPCNKKIAYQNNFETLSWPVKIAKINKITGNKYWREFGEKESFIHYWWDVTCCSYSGNQRGEPSKS